MRAPLSTRACFIILISVCAGSWAGAQVPADPYARENEQIRMLIKSGNQKVLNKDYDGAIADFTDAIEIGKDLPDILRSGPYVNRGLAYEKKGDLDAALADLNKSIKIQSNNFYAYQDRAVLYEKRNELDAAIGDYTKVIKLNSKFAPAYSGRGLILLRQGKDTEAEADFARYLELNPAGKDSLAKQIVEIKAKRAASP